MSGWAAMLALAHPAGGPAWVFVVPAAALAALTIATISRAIWAYAIDTFLLAPQIVGALGSVVSLTQLDSSDKAAQLRALGLDPVLGLVVQLIYSAIGTAVFVRLLARMRRARTD